jgi:Tfp pilus assembly protein FimV
VRALEEELVAREKALAEANDRVKQLEKTLKDMQKLVELKGATPATAKPEAKGEAPKPAEKSEPPEIRTCKNRNRQNRNPRKQLTQLYLRPTNLLTRPRCPQTNLPKKRPSRKRSRRNPRHRHLRRPSPSRTSWIR